jgi:vacuolar-type H+-ATPase subunit D/Vma8
MIYIARLHQACKIVTTIEKTKIALSFESYPKLGDMFHVIETYLQEQLIATVVESMNTVEQINADIAPEHVARKPSKSNVGTVPQIKSDLNFCKEQIKLITGCVSKLKGKLEELSGTVQDMEGGGKEACPCACQISHL